MENKRLPREDNANLQSAWATPTVILAVEARSPVLQEIQEVDLRVGAKTSYQASL